MAYHFSHRSQQHLADVHPDLAKVVESALNITPIDFSVLEGLRTLERQLQLVHQGASKTMNSRHLTGHAVDLGAYIDGGIRWDFGLYVQLAQAIQEAAIILDIPVVWGGCWQCLNDEDDLHAAVADYVQAQRKKSQPAFIDACHFQLPWAAYPNNAGG